MRCELLKSNKLLGVVTPLIPDANKACGGVAFAGTKLINDISIKHQYHVTIKEFVSGNRLRNLPSRPIEIHEYINQKNWKQQQQQQQQQQLARK